MGRCGYSDDYSDWDQIKWRGQVASAIRGKRGQAFLRELIEALDALPKKELITDSLECDGEVCALGAVGVKRKLDMSNLDVYDPDTLGGAFGIAHQLIQEIEWINDEWTHNDDDGWKDPKEIRWQRVRDWAASKVKP